MGNASADQQRFDTLITVVARLHNHEAVVRDFTSDVYGVLSDRFNHFEILFVDDGSTDGTVAVVRELLQDYQYLRLIRLSRSLGVEIATTAGLDSAIGDLVVTMDVDRDPADQIVPAITLCVDGYDLVQGVATDTAGESVAYRWGRWCFYRISRWLVRAKLTSGATRFRVMSRYAINTFTRVRQKWRSFEVLADQIGYRTQHFPYQQISRSGQIPTPSVRDGLRRGLSLIINNSKAPLRFASLLGVLGGLFSVVYSLYVVLIFLFKDDVRPGWTTLSLQVSGLFLLLFVMQFLISEYVARLVDETSDRPLYHVVDEEHSSVLAYEDVAGNVLAEAEDHIPNRSRQ